MYAGLLQFFNHIAIVFLAKESIDAFGDYRSNIGYLRQLFLVGFHQGIEVSKVACKGLCRGLTHLSYTQRKQEPR